jgi:capsular polysaccharide biosynthesis protein
MSNGNLDFTVRDILRTLRRQWKIVVGVPLVVTVAAALFSLTLKNTYEAQGTLEIGRVMEYPLEAPPTVVDRMGSPSFLAGVGKKLGLKDTPAALANMVTVESIFAETRERNTTRGVKVTVRTDGPEKSATLARAIMEDTIAEHDKIYKASWDINYEYLKKTEGDIIKLQDEIDRGHEEISRLVGTGRLTQVEMSYLASYVEEKESYIIHLEEAALNLRQKLMMEIYTNRTRIMVDPVTPLTPAGPRRIRMVLLALGISFVLGIIVSFFFDRYSGEGQGGEAPLPTANEKKKEPTPIEPAPAPEPPMREPAREPAPSPEPPRPEPPRVPPAEVNSLTETDSLTFSDFWRILRSQAWVVGVTVFLGLVLGLVYGLAKPREYKADFVVSMGIVGDHWVHSPMVLEEECLSHWFLDKLSARLNRKYDVFELQDMIEAELVMTPTKGLTRELKITVKADSPESCYALATNLGQLLEEADTEIYEETHKAYESYLADLEKVMKGLTTRPGAVEPSALAPGLTVYPPDELTEYTGGPQIFSLHSRSIPYEENPYVMSSLALFQQVYIDTYIKTRSAIFSQPTTVIVPPLKPTKPEGPGPVSIVLIVVFVSLVLGVTLAAVNYRLLRSRSRA